VEEDQDVHGMPQKRHVQYQLHQQHQLQRQSQSIAINTQLLLIVQVPILVHGMEQPVLTSQDVQHSHRPQMINVQRFQPDVSQMEYIVLKRTLVQHTKHKQLVLPIKLENIAIGILQMQQILNVKMQMTVQNFQPH